MTEKRDDSREPTRCLDCRVAVAEAGEGLYVVEDQVWAESGLGPMDGHLCIGCVEKRLGRTLVPDDFPDAPFNESGEWASDRLVARTGYREPRRGNRIMQILASAESKEDSQ